MNERKGKLIVVSGPSGVGKSTVIGLVMERRSDLCFSVSATTRAPREGETDGVSYFFVTGAEFDRMIGDDELLEHAEYNGKNYGTPRNYVEVLEVVTEPQVEFLSHAANSHWRSVYM